MYKNRNLGEFLVRSWDNFFYDNNLEEVNSYKYLEKLNFQQDLKWKYKNKKMNKYREL